jgi:hypothetical protein
LTVSGRFLLSQLSKADVQDRGSNQRPVLRAQRTQSIERPLSPLAEQPPLNRSQHPPVESAVTEQSLGSPTPTQKRVYNASSTLPKTVVEIAAVCLDPFGELPDNLKQAPSLTLNIPAACAWHPLKSPNRLNLICLQDVTCHRICPGA